MPFVIPPLLMWTLGALGVGALAKTAMREWRRVNDELEARAAAPQTPPETSQTLRADGAGVYRPDPAAR